MGKWILSSLAALLFLSISGCNTQERIVDDSEPCVSNGGGLIDICDNPSSVETATGKPVIYFYPEEKMTLRVALDYAGTVMAEYPQTINHEWEVTAYPDGQLEIDGRTYRYLFWDGLTSLSPSHRMEGFVVSQKELPSFLEEKLSLLGLNSVEQADFITYWWPRMENHEWIFIRFDTDYYDQIATLLVDPLPDQVIRVFAVFKGLEAPIDVQEQILTPVVREDDEFVVVDWGGTEI